MAQIGLSSGWSIIPKGWHVFKIVSVEYNEDFGRLLVNMATANGAKHQERFSLLNQDGSANEKALNAFSFFAKTALNNYDLTTIDHNDLVGHFILAEVTHTIQPNRNHPERTVTFINLGNKKPAESFDTKPDPDDTATSNDKPDVNRVTGSTMAEVKADGAPSGLDLAAILNS